MKHDYSDFRWYDLRNTEDVSQPKVGPYIYGLSFHLAGINNIEDKFQQTRSNNIVIHNKPWWIALWGKKPNSFPEDLQPTLELIWVARKTSILFTVGAVIIIYILCALLISPLFGLLTAVLLTLNNLLMSTGKFAMTDSMQLFFFNLNLLLFYLWNKSHYSRIFKNQYLISIFIGINCALLFGVKTSGVIVIIFLFITLLLVTILDVIQKKSVHNIIISICIILSVSAALFYILHPFLYNNLLSGLKEMYYIRNELYKDYWKIYPGSAVTSTKQALHLIIQRTLSPSGDYINFPIYPLPIDIFLFTAGLFLNLFFWIKSMIVTKKFEASGIIPMWTITAFTSLLFYLVNDWSRYYVPFVSCIVITQAYMILHLFKYLVGQIKNY